MAPSILIFDFGTNEEAAQQAKHKIEGWQQGFRLGKKIAVKFEREDSSPDDSEDSQPEEDASSQSSAGKKTAMKKPSAKKSAKAEKPADTSKVLLLIQLDFSDHEKLTHQRWLDRIPSEEPFKSAPSAETIRQGDPEFAKAKDRFDSLS